MSGWVHVDQRGRASKARLVMPHCQTHAPHTCTQGSQCTLPGGLQEYACLLPCQLSVACTGVQQAAPIGDSPHALDLDFNLLCSGKRDDEVSAQGIVSQGGLEAGCDKHHQVSSRSARLTSRQAGYVGCLGPKVIDKPLQQWAIVEELACSDTHNRRGEGDLQVRGSVEVGDLWWIVVKWGGKLVSI